MIQAIALDFGGVLYEINQLKTLQAFIRLSGSNSKLYNLKAQSYNSIDFIQKYETGIIDCEAFRNEIRNFIDNNSISDSEIDSAWNSTLIKLFSDTQLLIEHLSKNYKLYLLSNTNKIHYDYFLPECQTIFKHFDEFFYSFQIHKKKPNKDYFEYFLEKVSFEPINILFIDDLKENLKPAEELGINTLHKGSIRNLSEILHSVNII